MTAEGNNKKEVQRLVEEINNRSLKDVMIRVDVNRLSPEKLVDLIVISRQLLSGLSESNMKVMVLELDALTELTGELSSEVKKLVDSQGSKELAKTLQSLPVEDILHVINYLNNKSTVVESDLDIQKEYYERILDNSSSKEFVPLSRSKRFNFKTVQTNLFSLYDRCFNMVGYISHPYLSINPNISFQRKLVWPVEKKISFIDSLINDIPIGAFYVNSNIHNLELGEGFGQILWDGKQRLYALHSFILDEFTVEVNGIDVYYSQSPAFFNSTFNNTSIVTFESSFETLREVIEAYIAINKKQIRHTDEDLEHAINILLQQA
jgi:hypothetical protein